jgi:hypothetical protein
MNNDELDNQSNKEIDGETKEFMENYALDKDTAEQAVELRNEGFDDDDAAELAEEGIIL